MSEPVPTVVVGEETLHEESVHTEQHLENSPPQSPQVEQAKQPEVTNVESDPKMEPPSPALGSLDVTLSTVEQRLKAMQEKRKQNKVTRDSSADRASTDKSPSLADLATKIQGMKSIVGSAEKSPPPRSDRKSDGGRRSDSASSNHDRKMGSLIRAIENKINPKVARLGVESIGDVNLQTPGELFKSEGQSESKRSNLVTLETGSNNHNFIDAMARQKTSNLLGRNKLVQDAYFPTLSSPKHTYLPPNYDLQRYFHEEKEKIERRAKLELHRYDAKSSNLLKNFSRPTIPAPSSSSKFELFGKKISDQHQILSELTSAGGQSLTRPREQDRILSRLNGTSSKDILRTPAERSPPRQNLETLLRKLQSHTGAHSRDMSPGSLGLKNGSLGFLRTGDYVRNTIGIKSRSPLRFS
jgi:hypothetical protein